MPSREEIYEQADKLKDQGDLPGAVGKYQEALAIDADFALAHHALALVLPRLQRFDEAIAHAKRVCELEPNDFLSYTVLSRVCQQAGRIMEAEDALARSRMLSQQRR